MTKMLVRIGRVKRDRTPLLERFMWSALRAAALPLIYGLAEVVEPFGGKFFG